MGVPEIAYIVEKLYNMIVYYSSQAALKEANRKELEARLSEVFHEISTFCLETSPLAVLGNIRNSFSGWKRTFGRATITETYVGDEKQRKRIEIAERNGTGSSFWNRIRFF